jgi:uncharacterized protein with NAD-binding domain and iron-sulfur cluster
MKIAIFGGGVGSMTAAYWLTNTSPDGPAPEHEVTIYQLGWRLGGKGTTGRKPSEGYRIQEHGLHMWMGFYANAFRMMRTVYGALGREWTDAFSRQTISVLMQQNPEGGWMDDEWVMPFPLRPGVPGDQTGFPTPIGYLGTLTGKTAKHVDRFLRGHHHHHCPPHELSEAHRTHFQLLHGALTEAAKLAGPAHEPGRPLPVEVQPHHHLVLRLALEGVQKLIGAGFELTGHCLDAHRVLLFADITIATAVGIVRDLSDTTQWDAIDDVEWQTWLTRNGLHPQTEWCPVIHSLYDLIFAYRGGVAARENADVAAGAATCAWLRMVFDYYDSLFFRMNFGMGDTIFGPLYQVLKSRGVKFRFFHRLRDVVPSADGTAVDELRIGVQATTIDGAEYQPFIPVKNLDCWPDKPLYGQLQQGRELEEQDVDLEDYNAPWKEVDEVVLRRENGDFDLAVFGLSLGAVPHVCGKILEQNEAWRRMVQEVKVVNTQAFQFWLNRNVADLGWRPALNGRCFGQRAVLSTFAEPIDTWADMSSVIPAEDWKVSVRNVAYFCGPARDGITLQEVIDKAHQFVDTEIGNLWPLAAPEGKFRYDWLAVENPQGISDRDRFFKQYFRINDQPTEKYVMSVTGSTRYRLNPAHPGYDNLVLAGDWVYNGFPIGCVESAVLGAMKGVQRFCKGMVIVE